jgi:hypothetical protein
MFFKKARRNAHLDRICLQQFQREQDNIHFRDNTKPLNITDNNMDTRAYVGCVGIYRNMSTREYFHSTKTELIPVLSWYCRKDGNIWCEWHIRADKGTPLWNQEISWDKENIQQYTSHFLTISVPMSQKSITQVNKFTREHWIMHKLSSDTLV